MAKVAVIMGSETDMPIMKKACETLNEYGVDFTTTVLSAHRTPNYTSMFASTCRQEGIDVIIAGAGSAAHLPGIVASYTTIPVIGVPLNRSALNGTDALYAIVQMPAGIPVATVGIDNSANAALLAIQILGLQDETLVTKMAAARDEKRKAIMKTTVDWRA